MTEYITPKWTWDEGAKAGYIDFDPDNRTRRFNSQPFRRGGVTFLIDRDAQGNTLGIEVLV